MPMFEVSVSRREFANVKIEARDAREAGRLVKERYDREQPKEWDWIHEWSADQFTVDHVEALP